MFVIIALRHVFFQLCVHRQKLSKGNKLPLAAVFLASDCILWAKVGPSLKWCKSECTCFTFPSNEISGGSNGLILQPLVPSNSIGNKPQTIQQPLLAPLHQWRPCIWTANGRKGGTEIAPPRDMPFQNKNGKFSSKSNMSLSPPTPIKTLHGMSKGHINCYM